MFGKNKLMSEADAKEAVTLLSKAYDFIVVKKFVQVIGSTGDEETYKREDWHLTLAWSIDKKTFVEDEVYVKNKMTAKMSVYKIKMQSMNQYASFPLLARALSGAKLCSYTMGSEEVDEVSEIPEFKTLNELKMKLTIAGLI